MQGILGVGFKLLQGQNLKTSQVAALWNIMASLEAGGMMTCQKPVLDTWTVRALPNAPVILVQTSVKVLQKRSYRRSKGPMLHDCTAYSTSSLLFQHYITAPFLAMISGAHRTALI